MVFACKLSSGVSNTFCGSKSKGDTQEAATCPVVEPSDDPEPEAGFLFLHDGVEWRFPVTCSSATAPMKIMPAPTAMGLNPTANTFILSNSGDACAESSVEVQVLGTYSQRPPRPRLRLLGCIFLRCEDIAGEGLRCVNNQRTKLEGCNCINIKIYYMLSYAVERKVSEKIIFSQTMGKIQ